jgi:hypothetical protein
LQRYEYRELITERQAGTRVWYVDDHEQPDWQKGPRIVEYLNQLGAEGWELVSVCAHSGPWNNRLYTLRRPLA